MKIKNIVLAAILVVVAVGCNRSETSNDNATATGTNTLVPSTNTPASTNVPPANK